MQCIIMCCILYSLLPILLNPSVRLTSGISVSTRLPDKFLALNYKCNTANTNCIHYINLYDKSKAKIRPIKDISASLVA